MATNRTGNGQLTKNFHISEFKCKDGTLVPDKYIPHVKLLAENLQVLRDHLSTKAKKDCPVHVNSGYRTPKYNAKLEGSAVQSQHLVAKAADIVSAFFTPKEVADEIELLIKQGRMKQGGLGRYKGFTHYDVRNARARWGKN
jgi:uncharacterized protein YcbK (DUF882 family)